MAGFNTKNKNNHGEYEITFYTDDENEYRYIQQCCRNVIDHAIEPERKKGRWIKKTIKKKIENDYSCSECGRHVSVMRGYDVRLVYPFCHCGADMTEGEG